MADKTPALFCAIRELISAASPQFDQCGALADLAGDAVEAELVDAQRRW